MDKFDYSRPIATAQRLIKRFGGPVTLRVPGAATGPSYAPTFGASTDYELQAVVQQYTDQERAGTSIKSTDRKVMLSTEGVTVEPGLAHTLIVDGVDHSILNVSPWKQPTRDTVFWEVRIGK